MGAGVRIFAAVVLLSLVTTPSIVKCLAFQSANIQSALVDIRLARVPQDLVDIRECRSCDPQIVASALPKFLSAESLSSGLAVGIIAKERLYPFRVLGCTDVRFNVKAKRALLQNVYVRTEAQGLGLGTRMVEFVEKLARAKGVETLELNVDTNNIVAVSLYKKCGFGVPGIHSVVNLLGRSLGVPLQISMAKNLRSG
jgi:ribosomal protein S18 acetylase RimI-like enzyme